MSDEKQELTEVEAAEQGKDWKTAGLWAAWAAGIFLLSGLLWLFTQNVREARLINTANKSLESQGYEFRVEKSPAERNGRLALLGYRLVLADTGETCVIFSMFSGGIPASCLAVLSEEGAVREMVPLSRHGQKILGRMPTDILNIYKHRIEAAEARLRGREQQ
jgi:hypothetical protein